MRPLAKIRSIMAQRRKTKERENRKRLVARAFADPASDVARITFDTDAIGMFAQLSACVKAAEAAERSNKRLLMRLTSGNYRDPGDDPDWFASFFYNKALDQDSRDAPWVTIRDGSELPFDTQFQTLFEAHGVFARHFGVQPHIAAQAEAFATAHDLGPHTLSLHYRGTDKFAEAPHQDIDDTLVRVARYAETLEGVTNIFVASDVARFVDKASAGIAGLPVAAMDDSSRSVDDKPVHLGRLKAGNKAMGRDAILNCLVLARGGWLCRTSSFLSAWSAVFNPEIKIATLNVPYEKTTWRLEHVVLKDAVRV